jgi:hypothetical protein
MTSDAVALSPAHDARLNRGGVGATVGDAVGDGVCAGAAAPAEGDRLAGTVENAAGAERLLQRNRYVEQLHVRRCGTAPAEDVDADPYCVRVFLDIDEVERIKAPHTHEHANLLLPLRSELVTQQGRLSTCCIEQGCAADSSQQRTRDEGEGDGSVSHHTTVPPVLPFGSRRPRR